jgi:putative effector of murein hydrolase LrgA (UPF0299 family)
MRLIRAVISLALIVIGGIIVSEMIHYPLRYSLTGIVLGVAMIALGIVRLRALYGRVARR